MREDEENDKAQSGDGDNELIPTISGEGSVAEPGSDSMEQVGEQIGPYKLLKVLGEGGYGIVYLAEQQKPIKRWVALKVIKPGMDSKQVIARFEAERQALALLDHPNIAHVFDAGTTKASRPYFVMEYVKGISLTNHCDQERLSIEQRLELFLQICEAVHYAHQKGIIHRDIKPSNILVSIEADKALPKIIDFGVAKALTQTLTERTFFTEQGQLIGTPEYMSPEQAKMTDQNIDERSDIYSLGVLLYVLLTGILPFDRKSFLRAAFAEMLRIIREEEPPRPSTRISTLAEEESTKLAQYRRINLSTLQHKLHGDLDWITLKTMDKEPERRYESAHALADDIRRHLENEPVLAGPPSKIYRLKKFVRKHRTQVIAVVCVLAVGLLAMLVARMCIPDKTDKGSLPSSPMKHIVAWYPFDKAEQGITPDSSGNNLHGKLVGNAKIVTDPERGYVLKLDGNGDYVDCGNNSIFNMTDAITVAAWVNITKVPVEWMNIVNKGETAWRLSTVRIQKSFHFAINPGRIGSLVNGIAEVMENQWHHVCGTYDGIYIRLYVDGTEDPQSPVSYSRGISTNSRPVYIGENSESRGRHWNGLIDDVRIYSCALSEEEIQDIFVEGLPERAAKLELAARPVPPDGGSVGRVQYVKLSWRPGKGALIHHVYFGIDPNSLELLDEVRDTCFIQSPKLEKLPWYYWRVDEEKSDGSLIKGCVWNFAMKEMVAWYKFDEVEQGVTPDSSGNNFHGKLVGDADIISDPERGKVLSLDGHNDYVSCGNDARFNITYEITIAVWIKVNLFGRDWKSIVTKGDTAWRLQQKVNSYNLKFTCDGLEKPIPWPGVESNVNIDNNRWYHIVGVYDGNKLYIYLDGKLDNYEVTSGTIATNSCQVFIGNNAQYPNRNWNGLIDDVRIYSYALNEDEIKALYFEGLPEKASRPVPGVDEKVGLSEEPSYVRLSWTPGRDVIIHHVYFGSDPNDMKLLSEVNDVDFIRSPNLDKLRCYYWRVDEEGPDGSLVEGNLWKFSTGGPLIGWWKFNGNAMESSGYDRNGNEVGNPTYGPGISGQALILRGDGDHVLVPEFGACLNGLNALTVCLWVKSNLIGTDSGFISFVEPSDNDRMGMRYDTDGRGGGGTNLIKCGITSNATGGIMLGLPQLESSSHVQTTEWQHLAMTWSNTDRLRLYINGAEDSPMWCSQAETGRLTGCTKLIIGKGGKDVGFDQSWNGLIDDVRIYNYALSETEIEALYTETKETPE